MTIPERREHGMEEQEKLVKLETPAEPEQPEEGFVPYCAEVAEPKKKGGFKRILLIILIVVIVLTGALLLYGRLFNKYRKVINGLDFDYRVGETVVLNESKTGGAIAAGLDTEIGRKQVTVQASMYLITVNEKAEIGDTASELNYTHNVNSDHLEMKTGVRNWPLTDSSTSDLKLENGVPEGGKRTEKPLLRDLLFGTQNHGGLSFQHYDSYLSEIGTASYSCEVWLLCDSSSGTPVYYTIYRYYKGGTTLAAVRILSNQDEENLMEIYDIKNYTIG